MKHFKKAALLLLLVALIVAVVVAVLDFNDVRPTVSYPALSTNPTALDRTEVDQLLKQRFDIRRNVAQLPPQLKHSFSNLSQQPFEMVNPGEPMSTDLTIPGLPNKALVFAEINESSAVLVFEVGSFVSTTNVVIFDFQRRKMWASMLEEMVDDPTDLRIAIREGRYRE